jgi:hypothetical protein
MEVRFRANLYSTTCAVSGFVKIKQRWGWGSTAKMPRCQKDPAEKLN